MRSSKMCCFETWVWVFPLIIAFGVPISFFVTYGIAVKKGHVEQIWPYISDTGTLPPESCIFGQLLNFGAVILAIIMYLRYRQVREWANLPSVRIPTWANKLSLVLAMISCLGLDIVANFQELNVLSVHLLGAITCFVAGTFYCIMQTVFTRLINPNAKATFAFRIMLSIISVGATIGALAPVKSAVSQFNGDNVLHWRPEHKGYGPHILSTSMEWVLVFAFCFFIGTLFIEFRNIRVSEPGVEVLNLTEKSPHRALHESYRV